MERDISNATTTTSTIADYSVSSKTIDEAGVQNETYWNNTEWSKRLGYLKTIPQFRQSVLSAAIWVVGKGWTSDIRTKIILEHITGEGKSTFQSIMENMFVVEKTNGDSYAEIIKEGNLLLNLKCLNPSNVRHVFNSKGLIIGYDIKQADGIYKRFKPENILHFCNDRIANEIHGTSVLESCAWSLDAKEEAQADWKRILHRSTIRVMYVDVENTTKLSELKTQYVDAIKKGEVLVLPGKKGDVTLEDVSIPVAAQLFMEWMRYLDNNIYKAIGTPEIILGGSQNYTEAGSKVGYLTYETPVAREQKLIEMNLWSQLGIKVEFEKPVSLKEPVQESEAANTGQLGFQPNEVQAQLGRTE